MAAEDKKRYDAQMQSVWLKGYFMLEDGTKSTDVQLGKRRTRAQSEVVESKTTATKRQKTAPAPAAKEATPKPCPASKKPSTPVKKTAAPAPASKKSVVGKK